MSKLNAGDVIRVRHNDVWQPAIVKRDDVHPMSYIVERDGNEYRRNRRQLLKTSEDKPLRATYDDDADTFHVPPVDVEADEVPPVPIAPRADVQRTPPRTLRADGLLPDLLSMKTTYVSKLTTVLARPGQVLGTSALFI